jgi:hypothetical protein
LSRKISESFGELAIDLLLGMEGSGNKMCAFDLTEFLIGKKSFLAEEKSVLSKRQN